MLIDMHTHMLSQRWMDLLAQHGGPQFSVMKTVQGVTCIALNGAPFMTPMPGHFDLDLRIAHMDDWKIDLGILSLTTPNVYFGGPQISLLAAQVSNEDMAQAQAAHPGRLRWLASLPWEYPQLAVAELARARADGAVGVMVLANINGRPLTDPAFAPVWQAIDDAALPVLVHPASPPGAEQMDLRRHDLTAALGFMMDTTLAFTRIFYDGFLDRYPRLKLIAPHAGGTLPYVISRLDRCYDIIPACREDTDMRPGDQARRVWYDAQTYAAAPMRMCLDMAGANRMMFGSDFPHNIGDTGGFLDNIDSLPPDQARQLRCETAQKLFGL
jgi:aminocarboxymuconate-semialdehyde decarboxylase